MTSFTKNPIISLSKKPFNTKQILCRKYKSFLPNIIPSISSLSNNISAPGAYSLIYINGLNFTPYNMTVTFGSIQNIPIVFYSSFSISFVVPLNLSEGNYSVQVVANNNNTLISGLLYSNTLDYTIQNYSIVGTYSITDDSSYNTVINFSGNSTIIFYNVFNVNWVITGNASVTVNNQFLSTGEYNVLSNIQYNITLGIGSVTIYFNV
jgi:hypothetical protein